MELIANGFKTSFIIFISSVLATLVVNIIILVQFWRKEWSSNVGFKQWFYQHSGMISFICFICSLTDCGLVVNIFTSHIFGHSVFYSPLSMNIVKIVQISSLIAILVEHAPQIWVEWYVIMYESKNFTNIMIAALIVSLLDVGFILTKSIFWCVAYRSDTKMHSVNT